MNIRKGKMAKQKAPWTSTKDVTRKADNNQTWHWCNSGWVDEGTTRQ